MLKKILHISLVGLLLVSTMGITFYKHYCNGHLISKSFLFPTKSCCNDHCKACHNENKTYKITDNYETDSNVLTFKSEVKKILNHLTFDLELLYVHIEFNISNHLSYHTKICNIPPLIAENPSATLQVFRL